MYITKLNIGEASGLLKSGMKWDWMGIWVLLLRALHTEYRKLNNIKKINFCGPYKTESMIKLCILGQSF